MPDCVPAATPILCADLKKAYTLVVRAGVTMLTDPYSAGWCVLYRFNSRVGGNVTCPLAARLRVR